MKKIHSIYIIALLISICNGLVYGQIIRSVAGNGIGNVSGNGGIAGSAGIGVPYGVAVDRKNNIYITDNYYYYVRKVTPDGIISNFAGVGFPGYSGDGGPATSANISTVNSIITDSIGNVYIADGGNYAVRKIDTNGIITTVAGGNMFGTTGDGGLATSARLGAVNGLCFDKKGNLYIAAIVNVRRVNTLGIISTFAGTGGFGYSGDGGAATSATFNSAFDVAADNIGNIYICDNGNHMIRRVDTFGIITRYAGQAAPVTTGGGLTGNTGDGGASTSAFLNNPTGIATDSAGNLYIADQGNFRVRRINTSTGIISAYSGNGLSGSTGDGGTPLNARHSFPNEICFGNYNQVFIVDKGAGPSETVGSGRRVRHIYTRDSLRLTITPGTSFCSTVPVTITANRINPAIPFYQKKYVWRVNGTITGTDTSSLVISSLNNGDKVWCTLQDPNNSNVIFANSDTVRVTVTPAVTPTLTVTSSGDTICAGNSINFSASSVNGGSTPTYRWRVNSNIISTGATFSYAPVNGDTISCTLRSNATCAIPDSITINRIVTVNNITTPSAILDTALRDTICGSVAVTYSLTTTNLGTSPIYRWKVNNTVMGTSSTFTYTPVDGDRIHCTVRSSLPCPSVDSVNSDTITQHVFPVITPSISITSSITDSVCYGTTAIFHITATGTGEIPVYEWRVNGSIVSSDTSYSYTPNNGDVVNCTLYSSAICASPSSATSNNITMPIKPLLTPSVTLTSSEGDTLCSGTILYLNANPVNGGTSPSYNWLLNGSTVSTTSSYSFEPANGDVLKCIMHSNACTTIDSAISDSIYYTVTTTTTPYVTINSSTPDDTSCIGTIVTYNAVGINVGATPRYYWFINGSLVDSGITYAYIPTDRDSINCMVRSSATCSNPDSAWSNTIRQNTLIVTHPAIDIAATPASPICFGTPVTYTSSATDTGTRPTYIWFKNDIAIDSSAGTYTISPNDGDNIKCLLINRYRCASPDSVFSSVITYTVNPLLTPSINISASADTICSGATVTFTSTIDNGGSSPILVWIVNGSNVDTGNSFSTSPLEGDTIHAYLLSNATCRTSDSVSSNNISTTVLPILTPTISISIANDSICAGSSNTFNTTTTNGGSSPSINWYVNNVLVATSGASYTYIPSNNDSVKATLISNASCLSVDSNSSNIIRTRVDSIVSPTISIASNDTIVCRGSSVFLSSTISNGGLNPAYNWYINNTLISSSDTFSIMPDNQDSIYCIVFSSYYCATPQTDTSLLIHFTVDSIYSPSVTISNAPDSICLGSNTTLSANVINGGTAPKYKWYINKVLSDSTSTYTYQPSLNDTVYCIVRPNLNCLTKDSAKSNTIYPHVIIPDIPTISISVAPNDTITLGDTLTFTASTTYGGSNPSFSWYINGAEIAGTNYFKFTSSLLNDGDIVSCRMTSNIKCAEFDTVMSNLITVSIKNPEYYTNTILITPNPSTGTFNIKGQLNSQGSNTARIDLYNITGKSITATNISVNNGKIESTIQIVDNLPSAVYMLVLTRDDVKISQRIVIQK